MNLHLITECKRVHRAFHFPQFKVLDPVEFKNALYFGSTRKRDDNLGPLFKKALELMDTKGRQGFIEACELAGNQYGYELYLDLQGRVVFLLPEDR